MPPSYDAEADDQLTRSEPPKRHKPIEHTPQISWTWEYMLNSKVKEPTEDDPTRLCGTAEAAWRAGFLDLQLTLGVGFGDALPSENAGGYGQAAESMRIRRVYQL